MTRIAASQARENLSDTLNRVAYRKERIVLRRRGKDLAAVVPIEDLLFLEALEDRLDLEAAQKALKEKGTIPWGRLKSKLGL